jgi:hypothetical protein
MDIGKIQEMIQLNVTTLTELCRLFGGDMKKRRKGCILNVATTAAYQPTPFTAVYGATKSYVLSFSEALAQEMKDYGVSVTCRSPGPTDTNFFAGVGVEGLAEKARGIWAKSRRMPSRKAAEIGLDALFAGKLSVIAGGLNALVAFANRLAPRKTSARLSGKVMKQASTRGSVCPRANSTRSVFFSRTRSANGSIFCRQSKARGLPRRRCKSPVRPKFPGWTCPTAPRPWRAWRKCRWARRWCGGKASANIRPIR